MGRTIGIGHQNFEDIRIKNNFYVDKTHFIKEWWEADDAVTLIARPRRFGKTLNMSMLEQFFSVKYAGRQDLFEGLSIWEDENYHYLQGTYPVISLSFANVKARNYKGTKRSVNRIIEDIYNKNIFLLDGELLTENEKLYFGFVEKEVFAALDEFDLSDRAEEVKGWYDGFTFGACKDIYNPWSIINFLDKKEEGLYWANTSSNSLVEKLLRESNGEIKQIFERLLEGGNLVTEMDEQIVYHQLNQDEKTIWALLLASGYLKVNRYEMIKDGYGGWKKEYTLGLTNFEVRIMFRNMIQRWFGPAGSNYNGFIKALLSGDVDAMNDYMNEVSQSVFSCFDTGKNPSKKEPERFYHGFVLGLMVELRGRYVLTSNRESGFGRYDVMMEPLNETDDGVILEFKVFQPKKEKELADTVKAALRQIEEKNYEAVLEAKGIAKGRIRKYGFAFCGNEVLIGGI